MTELNRIEAVKIEGRQYVVIDSKALNIGYSEGDIATLTRDDGTRMPRFQFDDGNTQYIYMTDVMLLAETEAPEPEKVTEFEVGTVYTSVDKDGICKNADGVYSYADFEIEGHFNPDSILDESDDDWTIATAEQAAEFNKRKLQHQLDNLKVGEVYVINLKHCSYAALLRFKVIGGNGSSTGVYGNHMHLDANSYYNNSFHFGNTEDVSAIRQATAEEIAELEAAEIKAGDREKPAEPELPEHKFAVGDKLEITPDKSKKHYFEVGDVVTVIAIDEDRSHQNGIPKYLTGDGSGLTQYLLESQLKAVEAPQQFIPEIGKIYFGGGTLNNLLQVSEIDTSLDNVGGTGFWGITGYTVSSNSANLTGFADRWTEATPEQAVKLLQLKVDHSDATEADLKQLSELMPMDNPELTAWEVYTCVTGSSELWAYRYRKGGYATSHIATICLSDNFFDTYCQVTSDTVNYRKALPHEVAQLEAAEKEHGCEYVKPLINSKGTVIEVGQYYKSTRCDGLEMIYKVTSVDVEGGNFLRGDQQLQLSTGTLEPVIMGVEIDSIYGNTAVPATPAEIEQFRQAEAKGNFKLEVGKQYEVAFNLAAGETELITVAGIAKNGVSFTYAGKFGQKVCECHSIVSDIWATAVEVK